MTKEKKGRQCWGWKEDENWNSHKNTYRKDIQKWRNIEIVAGILRKGETGDMTKQKGGLERRRELGVTHIKKTYGEDIHRWRNY